jgi:hypothetical protein
MREFAVVVIVGVALGASARSDQYWVSYDASSGLFPEEVGWTRTTYGGGDQRWFQDGALVLDGRASIDIADFYDRDLASLPGAGEMFRMDWRLRVDQVAGFADPCVAVNAAGHGTVCLRYRTDAVYSMYESVWIPFAPGVFHDFSFASADLATYTLRIDGVPAYTGQFVGPWPESSVQWGDGTQGAGSLSAWSSVAFGNVPEPSASLILGCAVLACIAVRDSRAWR